MPSRQNRSKARLPPDYKDPPLIHRTTQTGIGYANPAKLPDTAVLQRAAEVLNPGKKVAFLVGAGARAATDEVIAIAERRSAGVAKASLGKAVLPDDPPAAAHAATCVTRHLPGWIHLR